uniref:Uncharacterized protein n=1 Tax=Spironucleus salmonicida TaxID=348837 RepID=V6LEM4_9EUKA|eukprot:EST42970.1 Hypothetical protein SS50377_17384 [Spironucleus salmonicida]
MHDLRQFEQFVHFQLGIFSLPHKLSYLLITISATLNSHYKLQLQTLLVSLLEVIVSGHHEERSCKCRPWKRFSDVLLAGARSAERNELDSIFWSFCGFWFWVCRGATGGFWTVWCNWDAGWLEGHNCDLGILDTAATRRVLRVRRVEKRTPWAGKAFSRFGKYQEYPYYDQYCILQLWNVRLNGLISIPSGYDSRAAELMLQSILYHKQQIFHFIRKNETSASYFAVFFQLLGIQGFWVRCYVFQLTFRPMN